MKSVFLIIAGIMFILANADTPEKCYGEDEITEKRCCMFPPFFTSEVAKYCGAQFTMSEVNWKANFTSFRRKIPNLCGHWRCVLEQYGLLDEDNLLVLERYYMHMDQWVELNPEFNEVMFDAKVNCKRAFKLYMPLTSCMYRHFHMCIREYIRMSCPKVINDELCLKQKAFFEECRQYYL